MKKVSNEKRERYIKIEHYMMDTAAWTALSDRAVWLFLELQKQFDTKKGGNEHLILSYSKVRWRMSTHSYIEGMRELCHYGFLRVKEPGGLLRRPTVYALSEHWREVSREIVDREGKEAIQLGLAKKRRSWDRLRNLGGHRPWEK